MAKLRFLSLFLLLVAGRLHAQDISVDSFYFPDGSHHVNRTPGYPGGSAAFHADILANLDLSEMKKPGKIILQFVIDTSGTITNPKVVKSYHKKIDALILARLSELKKFSPATMDGKPVKFIHRKFELPIDPKKHR